MIIGIPKEIMLGENRVSATPDTVALMVNDGHQVLVERGAGQGSHFSDSMYEEKGGKIIEDARDIFKRAQVILKVKEPLFNTKYQTHEVDMMHQGQYIISFLHPASPSNHEMVRRLADKGVISLTLDGIPRISRAQNMDALTSMSTVAGYKGILIAANHMAKFVPPIFSAVGGSKPAKALIIGAGVGGLQALATAKRLGALTYALDIRPQAQEEAKSLGAKVIDPNVPQDLAVGEGGYAKALDKTHLEIERKALSEVLADMDIIFLSALVPGRKAPILITKDMLSLLKPGSVIIDISIDQGGNCQETVPGEIVEKDGVTICGIKNIPGMLPASATWMFAQNIYNLLKYLVKEDKIPLDLEDEIIQGILTTKDFKITHQGTLDAMNEST